QTSRTGHAAAPKPGSSIREKWMAEDDIADAAPASRSSTHCAPAMPMAAIPRIQIGSSGVPATKVDERYAGRYRLKARAFKPSPRKSDVTAARGSFAGMPHTTESAAPVAATYRSGKRTATAAKTGS